jgi:hypothetical protein
MRLSKTSRLPLSVCAYFLFLSVVVLGGLFGTHAVLSATPPPGFLQADKPSKINEIETQPPLPAVVIKPQRQPMAVSTKSWTPSISRGFVEAPPAKEVTKLESKSKYKSRRASRKLSKEAKDAYASGRTWKSKF